MKLHFGVLLCLCALAASLTPLKDHSEHGLFDIPIQIKNDYEDTMDTDEHTIRSRVVSRRSHCLSYADCNGGWCHKGQCLDGACDGDKLCPDGYGYECDGKNCFKYRPPWVQEIPGNGLKNQILSTLLGRAKTPAEAQTSLKVYDQVRRPPTRRIGEASRDTELIAAGLGETKRLNLADLRAKLQPRWNSIIDSDNEKHRDEALELLVRELKS
ncbi:uncharacterized protein BDW43DRAFT_312823 [Aspergillus alliaceus]|uniref:uncharacterized protein n=1 Tax=Petromyces alliaceus TaxID=209559 RepID=UPI0012A427C9|nr:uncharacterized protein BDW43DRAFT_312823 [Aspergillus alliaceus]KAB8231598.1 hypothetical protein BDW43DRAFT_312823 [Aspergillus alliaceus]